MARRVFIAGLLALWLLPAVALAQPPAGTPQPPGPAKIERSVVRFAVILGVPIAVAAAAVAVGLLLRRSGRRLHEERRPPVGDDHLRVR